MKNWIKKIAPFLFRTRFHMKPNTDHEVELVFTSGGVQYFKFVNEFNIPYERAAAAMDIYREFEERTDVKYHKTAYTEIIEYCKKGNLVNAASVASFAIERMDNITNVDLLYKLASVLYFDANENCYKYDYEYNEKKIKKWKSNKDIEGFFLKTPLADYLPSFDSSSMNIQTYTEVQRKQLIHHLRSHLLQLSEGSSNKDLCMRISSQIQELEELILTDC